MARTCAGQRSGGGAATLATLAVALCCFLLPLGAQGAFVKSGNNYVAASCADLATAFVNIITTVADGGSPSYKFTVTLPCAAGSNSAGSWDAPDYTCMLPGSTRINLAIFITQPDKPTPVSIAIAADKKTCTGGRRPTLAAGADDTTSTDPILTFGGGFFKLSITNVNFDGRGVRPALNSQGITALTLAGVDIRNTTNTDIPSALWLVDTPTTYKCTKAAPCTVSGARTNPRAGLVMFPSAGGAIGIGSVQVSASFSASYVTFENNQHSDYGGVFVVIKTFSGPLSVKFTSCAFKTNSATLCSVGVTGRADPTSGGAAGAPLSLDFKGTTWSGNSATTSNAQARAALVCGLYSKSVPWSTSQASKVTSLPGAVGAAGTVHLLSQSVLDALSTLLGALLPSIFQAEYLVVDETFPAR